MEDEIWRAIVECDSAYDGRFYYGLVTTGIFCRPSCKSKTPNRSNVRIYNDNVSPLRDGLRPCKRCRPDVPELRSPEQQLTDQAEQLILGHLYEPLLLDDLASRLFVSPFYLQRSFTRVMGMSPSRYMSLRRLETSARMLVETGKSIADIARAAGFRSASYFSSLFQKEYGCTPSEYRTRMKGSTSGRGEQ